MRTVEIMGGLGNQLFQIFALLAYCLRHKKPFYFSAQAITNGSRKKTYWDTLLLKNLAPFVKSPPQQTLILYREPDFHYQSIPDCPQQYLKLFGYFQSYKYFADQAENIYRFLRLRETQATLKNTYTPQQPYENTIAVHFRVGDYAQLPNHHPLLTLDYYKQALTQFLQDISISISDSDRATALCETLAQAQAQQPQQQKWHLLYFCEAADQAYVETHLLTPLKAEHKEFTFECIKHELSDWEQVVVMSLCRHHIIANSTFSWWGAYLGLGGHPPRPPLVEDNDVSPNNIGGVGVSPNNIGGVGVSPNNIGGVGLQSGRVYYPTTWFGPAMGTKIMNDLFPPHWQRINV
jgi:pterin-4a-carbinolamine dehydratase